MVDQPPGVFTHPEDPDDSLYINVALAAHAALVVSRDADLLRLVDATTVVGRDFVVRFPGLEVLTPPALLERLRGS